MHVFSRRMIPLSGEWRLEVDQHDAGRGQRIWECRPLLPNGPQESFDLAAFRRIRVPGDWNRQFSDLAYYEGVCWYHRKVERPPGWAGHRAFIYFEAANYRAEVYWNGELLGGHEGGFLPFWFEVTGKLKSRNDLVVRVDAGRTPDGIPARRFDWFRYGGITRPVHLVLTPRILVRDFTVSTVTGPKGPKAVVEAWVEGARSGAEVRVILPGLGRETKVALKANGSCRAELALAANELWRPSNPRLHRIEIACKGDRIVDQVGFRTVRAEGGEILLNGSPVFLRGACLHEEAPRTAGRTLFQNDVDYVFKTLRALGANFVRLAHYPHTELMARTADRLGVLLWEEVPLWQGIDFKNRKTLDLAKSMIRGLVERDRNRASVIIWSVANETPETPERLRFLKALAKTARRLDPTRLVSAAVFASRRGWNFTIEDPLARELDVVGINQYGGWYCDKPKEVTRYKWRSKVRKPVIMTEFGAGARAGLRGKPDERWTEDYQAEVYGRQLDMIEKIRFLRGATPWILFDFRSPHRMNRHQQGYNRKGLVSDQGVRKLAFDVVKTRYEQWRKKWDKK